MKTATAAGLVIGLSFLTGCAVSVDGPTAPAAPASAQPSVPSETAPVASPTPSSTAVSGHDARRSRPFDVTLGCTDGELVLDVVMQTVLVNQDCKKITVSATQVTLLAEHVDSLILTDTAVLSSVTVRSADSIVIDGVQSEVQWEEGTPAKVQVRGALNTAGPIGG